MKQYLSSIILFSLLLPVACTRLEPEDVESIGKDPLIVQASVVGLTEVPTKAITDSEAEGKDARRENTLGTTLDVFVEGVTDPSFWREYHLTQPTAAVNSGVQDLLAQNWKSEGLKIGDSYNIYAVSGSARTNETVGSITALRALGQANTDIYKVYSNNATELDYSTLFSSSKTFMMDGKLENWTPDPNSKTQLFDINNMERASSKIVVEISFNPTFLNQLSAVGEPLFKYVNFATCSSVIREGSVEDSQFKTGSWTKMASWDENNHTAGIITYSYAFSWTPESMAEKAPYILVSFPLTPDGGETAFNYYRIPICPESTCRLERNTIYKVTATINSFGSTKLIEASQDVNLNYEVLEWTEVNSEVTNVVAEKLFYFFVTPASAVLRGNGTQNAVFTYYTPQELTVNKTAIPQNELISNTDVSYEAFYYNSSGTAVQVTDGYTITNDSGTNSYTVSSTVLPNHAVKYIRFRLSVTYTDDEGHEGTLTKDIYVTHYPLDNIQSIMGDWSSKKASSLVYSYNPAGDDWGDDYEGFEWVTDPPGSGSYESREEWEEVTQATWATGIGSSNDDRKKAKTPETAVNGYYATGGTEGTQELSTSFLFLEGTIKSIDRITWSVTNVDVNFTYRYLLRDRTATKSYSGFDYIDSYTGVGTTDVTLKTWTYNKYYHKVTKYKRYYKTAISASNNWVMWDNDRTTHTGLKTTQDDYFKAKKYSQWNNSTQKYCAPIVESRQSNNRYQAQVVPYGSNEGYFYYGEYRSNNQQYQTAARFDNLTNNRMYVLQITSASDDFIVGKPVLDNKKQSQDNVLFPAFMIASQLGATSADMGAETAARHCFEYMEVDTNGKKFVGWRLPTNSEISVILNYQYDPNSSEIITEVLGGERYYNLSGSVSLNSHVDDEGHVYVRCIREMSSLDLDYLEGRLSGTEFTNYINN